MKKIFITLMALVLLALPVTNIVFAGDDNISYEFRIPGGSGKPNGQESKGQYRQTSNPENPWKVQLKKSEEGDGTITTFWLEKRNGANVSKTRNAKCKGPAYYTNAYKSASEVKVYLTAENNNDSGLSYLVSGIWDEETW